MRRFLVFPLLLILIFAFVTGVPLPHAQGTYIFDFGKWDGYVRIPQFSIQNGVVTYDNNSGSFEFNITLSRRPPQSSFSINIERFGWTWLYQPPLDEELNVANYDFVNATHAILNGEVMVYRPENVVGSYAIYSSLRDNEYSTGKVLHLYRPLLIDANGARSWAVLNVTGSVFTISANSTWLQNAAYPVVIDPVFGYTNIGGTAGNDAASNSLFACKFTSPGVAVNIQRIATYEALLSGTATTKDAIYSDSAGSPSGLLSISSDEITITTTAAWYNYTMDYNTTASAVYWLANFAAGNRNVYWDSGSTGQLKSRTSAEYPTFPDPFASQNSYNYVLSIYAIYEVPGENYVDNAASDVDSNADIGTHSNFTAQQSGPDNVNDTLTEANTAEQSTSDVFTDGFEDGTFDKWTDGGTTTWGDGGTFMATSSSPGAPWAPHTGTYMADMDANDDGAITSDNINMSDAVAIGIGFWYMVDDMDANAGDLVLKYYNGSAYNTVVDLGGAAVEDQWYYYTATITDPQYFISTFRLQLTGTPGSGEAAFLDDVAINKTTGANNYELDLEEQWTTADYSSNNEELCIFAGPQDAEALMVDVWDGDSWENVIADLTANQWNNVSVTAYLTSATFTIRFVGGSEAGDETQSTWQIDAVLLHTWVTEGGTTLNYNTQLSVAFAVNKAKSGEFSRSTDWALTFGLFIGRNPVFSRGDSLSFAFALSRSSSFGLAKMLALPFALAASAGRSWVFSRETAFSFALALQGVFSQITQTILNLVSAFTFQLGIAQTHSFIFSLASAFTTALALASSFTTSIAETILNLYSTLAMAFTLGTLKAVTFSLQSLMQATLALAQTNLFGRFLSYTSQFAFTYGLVSGKAFNFNLATLLPVTALWQGIADVISGYTTLFISSVINFAVGITAYYPLAEYLETLSEEWLVVGAVIGLVIFAPVAALVALMIRRKKED